MADRLEIRSLGGLTVLLNGAAIAAFDQRKAPALLVYLACSEYPQPREVMAELLWEDRTQAQSLSNLRAVLSNLRKTVGPFVDISRESAGMSATADWHLDVAEFENLLADAGQDPALLDQAMAVYRGDFLEGFYVDSQAFEQWALLQRERLRFRAMETLDAHITIYLSQRDFAAGITHATRLLHIDPLREKTHRQLMELLAFSGEREAAMAQFHTCQRILETEIGVQPTPETLALYERIRAGQLAPEPAVITLRPPSERTPKPAAPPPLSVPVQATSFVGRETEIATIIEHLNAPTCRLITLVGPGGIGKTRLAFEVARRATPAYAYGAAVVELAGVAAADYLVPAMAAALHIQVGAAPKELTEGDSPLSERDPADLIVDYLRAKHMLLVLDNFEHLLEGVALIDAILAETPRVQIIVTTRVVLNSPWEHIYDVRGLQTPADGELDDLEGYAAVALFMDRAQRVQRQFDWRQEHTCVVRICQLLDGLPLGIELAASWLRVLSCADLSSELQRSLDFLEHRQAASGDRHASLRAVFEQSWRLLEPHEQAALMHLTAFRGSFTRDAAHTVADASLGVLSALVDKSLLRAYPSGRYDLHELVRQLAAERLSADPEAESALLDRHAAYYGVFVDDQAHAIKGDRQLEGLNAMSVEIDNVRAAFLHAVRRQASDLLLNMIEGLGRFYECHWSWAEGVALFEPALNAWQGGSTVRGWLMAWRCHYLTQTGFQRDGIAQLTEALALLREQDHRPALAFCLNALANEYYNPELGTPLEDTLALCHESLDLYRVEGDRFGEAIVLRHMALTYRLAGEIEQALACFERASVVARALNNPSLILGSIFNQAFLLTQQGDFAAARRFWEECLHLAEAIQNVMALMATLVQLGGQAWRRGDYDEARNYGERNLALARAAGDPRRMAGALNQLAWVDYKTGHLAAAKQGWEESLALAHALGDSGFRQLPLIGLGAVAGSEGRFADARQKNQMALAIAREDGDHWMAAVHLSNLSFLAIRQGDYVQARRDSLESIATLEQANADIAGLTAPLIHLGHAQVGLGELPEAVHSYWRALHLDWERDQTSSALESVTGLAHVLALTGDVARAVAILSFALNHPSTSSEGWEVFGSLWNDLQAELSPDDLAAAQECGHALDLAAVVDELLNDPGLTALAAQANLPEMPGTDDSA